VRLDRWLADAGRLGSRSRASEALLRGRVWVDDVEQTLEDGSRRLAGGESVRLWIDRPGSASRQGPHRSGQLDIVFEDRDLIVIDKPAGLLSVRQPEQPGAPSLDALLEDHWRSHAGMVPRVVHRLDRDTSGLVVFARTGLAQRGLKEQFVQRAPERLYLAVVHGVPTPQEGAWRTWLTWDAQARVQRAARPRAWRAFDASAFYRVVERFAGGAAALVEVRLATGKRHQIRVQACLAGHPLVGERMYTGEPAPSPEHVIPFGRQALHARRLAFLHPRSGERLVFEREPPADFAGLLATLRARS
jgi:23S rRNA pseudouridine1911/1915/1917 synthase